MELDDLSEQVSAIRGHEAPYAEDLLSAWQLIDWWRSDDKDGGYGEMSMRCEGSVDEGRWVVGFGVSQEGVHATLPAAICLGFIHAIARAKRQK
jgi:hypothetical protein